MNAKKNKNKKGHKQPNPTPPQKEETEKAPEKNDCENSERPDIVSDTVAEPEIEVPKKPKRNRGKKKKQDRDDDDNTEEKTPEPVQVTENKIEISEPKNYIETNKTLLSDPIENLSSPAEEIETEVPIIENVQKTEPFEFETKHSKKKNKKKKRHDSDKSDKSGDALSCTTAFQKLIDISDGNPTDKQSEDVEGQLTEDNILTMPEDEKRTDITPENKIPVEATSKIEKVPDNSHTLKEMQTHESKGKKNKKDKKYPPKTEDYSDPIIDASPKHVADDTEIKDKIDFFSTENIEHCSYAVKSENKSEDLVSPIEGIVQKDNSDVFAQQYSSLEISHSDDEISKPKAKIARPVDKKRKGKQEPTEVTKSIDICPTTSELFVLEQCSSTINIPVEQDIPQKQDTINAPELEGAQEPKDECKSNIITSMSKEEIKLEIDLVQEILDPTVQLPHNKDIIQQTKEIIPPVETHVSEQKHTDNKTGKKKRKPLKMPIPAPITPEPIKSLEEMTTELIKEGNEEIGDVESIFETLVPVDIEVKVTDEKLDEILQLKIESPNNKESASPGTSQKPEEKWIKQKKRGKKPVKMPPTPGVSEEKFNLETKETYVEPAQECKVAPQHSLTETLEITSVKADESECSPCDVTPDIVYPRSTSQLNMDDNNNAVIREILIPDTLDLPVGLTSPLIQGSGETPTDTPIMISSFNITELESPTEKTDLKSKVMEVNQDMEELRWSIERSLTELTAMEKSEEEVEKIYEDARTDNIDMLKLEGGIQEEMQASNKESINLEIDTSLPSVTAEIIRETERVAPLATQEDDKDLEILKDALDNQTIKDELEKPPEKSQCAEPSPVCPARRDNKSKGKKRKGKEASQPSLSQTSAEFSKDNTAEKTEQKTETKEESKQDNKQDNKQNDGDEMPSKEDIKPSDPITDVDYDPIENFEDALTTNAEDVDVNKTFEMILNEVTDSNQKQLASNKPNISITTPEQDFREGKVPQPKNLLGHPDIPVSSNKDDFKKEKHKNLNTKQAKVKIKDANDIESNRESKQCQTESKKKSKDFALRNSNENGDFVYKYSFRKVFLQNTCHVCAKELSSIRVPCNFCNLLFYCNIKHKDEDWPQHQALCFAISTIVHLKDQKHIYAEAKNITGQNYRLLRMQMILSCEKVLKRRLMPWEQEALLYPRICADIRCREWRQSKLKDCEGCGQISYCANSIDHLPLSHQRWCKSYALYQKLVTHQQTKGRLEPKLPTKVMTGDYEIPEKINEVLAFMYEEEIDMNDVQYAALTQIATAPLTVAYSHQLYKKAIKPSCNGISKSPFVIHVLGAELQFEADVLNKWEVFFLHLRPDVNEVVVVLISNNLNPGNLPLELLGKIRLCESCQQNKRRVIFSFQDKKSYEDYRTCDDFIYPDIVCTFNASINRSSYNAKDQWPSTITSVMKLRSPFLITSHTPTELHRDLIKIKEYGEVRVMVEPQRNFFASVRPDRNFITDDEAPLLFKNQCFAVLCGL